MDSWTVFPDGAIQPAGIITRVFLDLGIHRFQDACKYVHALPYGYNSDRDDLMILFRENRGTCTTKHAVIATLAGELNLPVSKKVGIYAMTEDLVSGTDAILEKFRLPYIPMIHCFLSSGDHRVDLTEGNNNGKRRSIEEFLFTKTVIPNISAKDEYLLYRKALQDIAATREELKGIEIRTLLKAREAGLELLKRNIR